MANRKPLNVLITSVSHKVPLVREVRKAVEKFAPGSRIIGGDSDAECIGRYFVDGFWEMPLLGNLEVEELKNYCQEHRISAIIPTRDGELEFFARAKQFMEANGVFVMTPPIGGVRICLDKLLFSDTFKDHPQVNAIHTATEPGSSNCSRWVVKERFGSGSRNTKLNLAMKEAREAGNQLDNPVYQPFIEGREFSVDIYLNKSGQTMGSVTRSRDRIVEGESQVTTTAKMPRIEKICSTAASVLGLNSHLVFQAIVDLEDNIHVIECNCRFGGASSLGLAAGLDSFYWFLLECTGDDLSQVVVSRGSHQLRQIRYPEDKIVHVDNG